MQLGMCGLGRMGANIARRAMKGGHDVVVWNRSAGPVDELASEGATGTHSLEDFVGALTVPRVAWVMVPAAVTDDVINKIADLMSPGDIVIDGGNSYYRDDVDRAEVLSERGLHYVDIGTSGGVWGLERGYCLMVGGETETVKHLEPLLQTIAPGVEAAERTDGRTGDLAPEEMGYLHCGPAGAGHFVKMVHNGIEYGLMAAYAEGLNVLKHANAGRADRAADAETAPLRDAKYYQYDIDIPAVTELWRRGSVVASWLLDLTAHASLASPDLAEFGGRVSDSGEGRWTLLAAIDEGVPTHVLSAALFDRFESRGESEYANRVLSAMRKEFGGHSEQKS